MRHSGCCSRSRAQQPRDGRRSCRSPGPRQHADPREAHTAAPPLVGVGAAAEQPVQAARRAREVEVGGAGRRRSSSSRRPAPPGPSTRRARSAGRASAAAARADQRAGRALRHPVRRPVERDVDHRERRSPPRRRPGWSSPRPCRGRPPRTRAASIARPEPPRATPHRTISPAIAPSRRATWTSAADRMPAWLNVPSSPSARSASEASKFIAAPPTDQTSTVTSPTGGRQLNTPGTEPSAPTTEGPHMPRVNR